MRACSMVSGGVFFIPDEIKRKKCVKAISYSDLGQNIENHGKSLEKADGPSSDILQEAA